MLHIQEDVILPPSVFHKLIHLPNERKRNMLLNVYHDLGGVLKLFRVTLIQRVN
jgi:hypothetical protein